MIFLLLILNGAGILWSYVDNRDGSRAAKEFYESECKQNITKKYRVCC